jgi:hypothetical protein
MKIFNNHWIIACLLGLFWTTASAQENNELQQYVAEGRSFKEHYYDTTFVSLAQFALLEPGIPLIPAYRGVFAAGWSAWLWQLDSVVVTGVYPCSSNETTYALLNDRAGGHLCAIKKKGDRSERTNLHDFGKGWFTLQGYDSNAMYVWGIQKDSCFLWSYNGAQCKKLYGGTAFVSDITRLSKKQIIAACNNGQLLLLEEGFEPFVLLKTDLELDGIEIASDGSIFLSSNLGVYRYYNLKDLTDATPVAWYIHGTLQLMHDHLYINWRERSEVVEINLFSRK